MSYQVLARKWRPRGFEEVVGQGPVVRALANALDGGRLHHAYLFSGTRGVGKTTLARILAKCLNCEQGVSSHPCGVCAACREIDEGRFVDLIEVDAASRTKVEDTRDLLENVPYVPTRGRFKVYLIDEVHMLSAHSFNALLKTLEEPPAHVKFLLATTDPQRLPVTVLSRCLQFSLKPVAAARIAEHLARVTAAEGVPAEGGALTALASAAEGSVRDALSLLDQAIAFGGGTLGEAEVGEMLGTLDRGALLGLLEALADHDGLAVLRRAGALADQVPDLDAVLADLAGCLHRVALLQVVGELGDAGPESDRLLQIARRLAPEDVQLWYQVAVLARRDLPLAPDPRTALEMGLLRMLAFRLDEGPARETSGATPGGHRSAPARGDTPASPPRQTLEGHGPVPGRADTPRSSPARPAPAVAMGSSPGQPMPAGAVDAPPGRPMPAGVVDSPAGRPERAVARDLPGEDWPSVVARLPIAGLVRELAANAVLLAHEGGTLRLRLRQSHAQMRSPAREGQLEEALSAHYGKPVRLVIEVGEGGGESPAQNQRRRSDERRAAAARALDRDPTVQSLRDMFGATVVPESVQPEGGEEEAADER